MAPDVDPPPESVGDTHGSEANHVRVKEEIEDANPEGTYVSGNQVEVTIKEEAELTTGITSKKTPLPLASKQQPKPANLKPGPTYACTICGASFPEKATTLQHIRSHGSQSSIKSRDHEAAKRTSKATKTPRLRQKEDGDFFCAICEKAFILQEDLRAHQEWKHTVWSGHKPPFRRKMYTCEFCGRTLTGLTNLKNHRRRHTGERPYACGVCEARFRSQNALTVHEKKGHEKSDAPKKKRRGGRPRTLSCTLCPRILHRAWEMPEHLEHHQAASPPTCSICGAVYGGEKNLAVHRAKVHPEAVLEPREKTQKIQPASKKKIKTTEDLAQPTTYPCPLCPRVYTNIHSLGFHTRRKHPPPGQAPFTGRHACDLCGKTFLSPSHLANHTRVHTGERPYHCTDCAYKGATKSNLWLHQRVHLKGSGCSVAKANPCTACPRGFANSAKLAKHLSVDHTLPSPWVCQQCGALYPTSASLNQHQTRVHPTEEEAAFRRDSSKTKWICPHCPRPFAHKVKLVAHLGQHKEPSSPRCDLCGAVYRLESHLRMHQVKVHQMEKYKRRRKILSEGEQKSDNQMNDDQMSSNSAWPLPEMVEESPEWDDDLEYDDDDDEEIVFCKTVP